MTIEQLTTKAINAAIKQDWQLAIQLNLQIIDQNPQDIAAYNRLAKAQKAAGNLEEARSAYQAVLRLDKYNPIAAKNLSLLENNGYHEKNIYQEIVTSFIDEPGKTTTASLCRIAGEKVICQLEAGQILKLIPKNHWISVNTHDDTRVGVLADESSFRLKRLINGGNKYLVAIKSVSQQKVVVFIKETHRAAQFQDIPSFQN